MVAGFIPGWEGPGWGCSESQGQLGTRTVVTPQGCVPMSPCPTDLQPARWHRGGIRHKTHQVQLPSLGQAGLVLTTVPRWPCHVAAVGDGIV